VTRSEHADANAAEDRMPVDQWLAIRKEAGLKIEPATAEVTFGWKYVTDPYGAFSDLTEAERVVGRAYFARSPDSDIWVGFDDLPEETSDELWKRLGEGTDSEDLCRQPFGSD
jgi:hypothetical protein